MHMIVTYDLFSRVYLKHLKSKFIQDMKELSISDLAPPSSDEAPPTEHEAPPT